MVVSLVAALATVAVASCGGGGESTASGDAAPSIDGAAIADGGSTADASGGGPDAGGGPTLPLAGFGAISGDCDLLGEAELTGTGPSFATVSIDFGTDRYDDPAERDLLTAGSVEMLLDGNEGGSSVFSEVFAHEVLARCELATFLKSETEVEYDVDGAKTDLLVEIDGHKIGVSVTRAMTFPFGNPYTVQAATTLLTRKLGDILESSANVAAEDAWDKQILAVVAYDAQHAQVAREVWDGLDAELRADTIFYVIVSNGNDTFIYTDE